MMELLSPAGGWEAMVAAVQNGADAVYMGFGGLNARRSARNFTDEEFREAVAYCHLRGVKVYLTLNTLVTDRELPAAAEALKKPRTWGWTPFSSRTGASGGWPRKLRRRFPSTPALR